MIINLKLDFDPETRKTKVISSTIEEEELSEEVPESSDPQLTLGKSNYKLNSAAMALLNATPESRLCIGYQPIGDIEFPVIGTEESFGCGGGNKISKNNTVVYKGRQFERLSEFGKVFTLAPLKGNEGIYILVSDVQPTKMPDEIEIVEDMNSHVDVVEESVQEPVMEEPAIEESYEPLTFEDDLTFDEPTSDEKIITEDALTFE